MSHRLWTLALVAALAACSSAATPARHVARTETSTTVPYSLYTHCGIREARVGTTYYVADHPLDDGNGNPPAGWGNPYQPGTMTVVGTGAAVFRDDLGHVVRFHARPGATGFLVICS